MTLFYYRSGDYPIKTTLATKDFSVPKDFLKTTHGGYEMYYAAGEWSKTSKVVILDKTFYGIVWVVKRDENGNFVEFDQVNDL